MKTKQRGNMVIYILFSIVITVLGFLIIKNMMTDRISWSITFKPDDSNPYGTKVLYNLMKEIRPDQRFIMMEDSTAKNLPIDPTLECDNYFFIGEEYYGDSAEVSRLLEFVKQGNNAFIFCTNQGNLVFDSLVRAPIDPYMIDYELDPDASSEYPEYEDDFNKRRIYRVQDSTITIYLKNNGLNTNPYDVSLKYDFKTTMNEWPYFKDSLITYQGQQTTAIGNFNTDYNNFIRMPHGKGHIYFHLTPIVFTNYYMINDTAMKYCRDALSDFGGGNIYWDEDNRSYDYHGTKSGEDYNPSKPGEGPLEFILSESSLRKAWYLMLGASILYLIFGARRKQRIIIQTENMENTSIEYASVISHMFLKQQDHKKLVMMKMELYKSFLRERFSLRLPNNMADENDMLYKLISQKSSINEELITEIFETHKYLSSVANVNTADMLNFHKKLEHFYSNCK
jgi:hypothetical protein